MQIRIDQLQALGDSANDQFLDKVVAHGNESFPQLPGAGTGTASVQTVASLAVAQYHGFSRQQDLAVCTSCVGPFVAGAANPASITGDAAQPLQTLIGDTQGVLSKLPGPFPAGALTPPQLGNLQGYCAMLMKQSGSAPINPDRSGAVVPFIAQSPVKPTDLAAAASSALPPKAIAPAGAVTQDQLAAAVESAQSSFTSAAPSEVVRSCKPLVDLEFRRVYWDGTPIPNIPYTVTLSDGSTRKGTTDGSGLAAHSSVPPGYGHVVYGENKNPAKSSVGMDVDSDFEELFSYVDGGVS